MNENKLAEDTVIGKKEELEEIYDRQRDIEEARKRLEEVAATPIRAVQSAGALADQWVNAKKASQDALASAQKYADEANNIGQLLADEYGMRVPIITISLEGASGLVPATEYPVPTQEFGAAGIQTSVSSGTVADIRATAGVVGAKDDEAAFANNVAASLANIGKLLQR